MHFSFDTEQAVCALHQLEVQCGHTFTGTQCDECKITSGFLCRQIGDPNRTEHVFCYMTNKIKGKGSPYNRPVEV